MMENGDDDLGTDWSVITEENGVVLELSDVPTLRSRERIERSIDEAR